MKDKKPYILLVDDDPLVIRMYQERLLNDGYDVRTAFDGRSALEMVQQEKPEAILMDIMMPVLNGIETLRALKENPATKDIPVFILTNLGDNQDDIAKIKNLGAKDYFVKMEISPKQVVKAIEQELNV